MKHLLALYAVLLSSTLGLIATPDITVHNTTRSDVTFSVVYGSAWKNRRGDVVGNNTSTAWHTVASGGVYTFPGENASQMFEARGLIGCDCNVDGISATTGAATVSHEPKLDERVTGKNRYEYYFNGTVFKADRLADQALRWTPSDIARQQALKS